ncbi:hypothetical protein [Paenibacillus contaminans]|uniref:hypothetical protein n=1 Tax=Paenibacillus contaminans TaxID=450362 RepID=UPI0011BF9B82|nr:hypothetical protein [Paenibacillus contaminans]
MKERINGVFGARFSTSPPVPLLSSAASRYVFDIYRSSNRYSYPLALTRSSLACAAVRFCPHGIEYDFYYPPVVRKRLLPAGIWLGTPANPFSKPAKSDSSLRRTSIPCSKRAFSDYGISWSFNGSIRMNDFAIHNAFEESDFESISRDARVHR